MMKAALSSSCCTESSSIQKIVARCRLKIYSAFLGVCHMSETGLLLPVPFQASPLLLSHHTFAPTTVMSSVRPMTPADLLKFNPCNLDHLTETYNIGFYLDYFSKWPELCMVIEAPHGEIEGYSQCLPLLLASYQTDTYYSPR
jgi:hypothetical protein